jgi:hypothetical protein
MGVVFTNLQVRALPCRDHTNYDYMATWHNSHLATYDQDNQTAWEQLEAAIWAVSQVGIDCKLLFTIDWFKAKISRQHL